MVVIVVVAALFLAGSNKGKTTIAPTALIDQYNGLYGIPNQGNFSALYSSVYPLPGSSAIVNAYGLAFTAPFIGSANATVLGVPAGYSNYTSPFLALEIASHSTNQSAANSAYKSLLGSVATPGSFANSAGLNFSSSSYPLGMNATIYSSDPYNVKLQGITFVYNDYVVQINTYGNMGKFNNSYAINLAKHIASIVS